MSFASIAIGILLFLLVLALLGALLFLYLYGWRMQRATPRLEGRVSVAGLAQSVEILRDKHGIPHLYAQSEADLQRALLSRHAAAPRVGRRRQDS